MCPKMSSIFSNIKFPFLRQLFQFSALLLFVELFLLLTRLKALPGATDPDILSLSSLVHDAAFLQSDVFYALLATLTHTIQIATLSFISGTLIAILTGWNAFFRMLLEAPVDFFRGIPATLLVVLGLVSFYQQSDQLLIITAAIPCTAICIFIVYGGISAIGQMRLSVYRKNHQPKDWITIIFRFVIPSLIPYLFQAARLIVPYSLVLAVALEMMQIGKDGSAGKSLVASQSNNVALDISSFVIIILLGFISFFLSKLLQRIDSYVNERSFR